MDLLTTPAHEWQASLSNGEITSQQLCTLCIEQINIHNSSLSAILNIAPTHIILQQASLLDSERASGHLRSPLHGIPIIIKDIFPTHSSLGLPTTGGSYALRNAYGTRNCELVDRLLDAGMTIIATTNLTELCGIKTQLPLGWSALGGQTQSPFVTGGVIENEAPCGNSMITGSSSGTAAGVAADFAPLGVGQETTGSLVIPANRGGLYNLKMSASKAPKEGMICLSWEYDSLGGMARCARDLRDLTRVVLGDDFVTGETEEPFRVGFVDARKWQYPDWMCPLSESVRAELVRRHAELADKPDFSQDLGSSHGRRVCRVRSRSRRQRTV